MKKTLILLAGIIFMAGLVTGDVYIKQKTTSSGMGLMGGNQPEEQIQEMWLTDNKLASHNPKSSFIIDLDKQAAYFIDHEDKSYVEMSLPIDMSKYMPEEAQKMMGGSSVKVTPTGEMKTINNWECKGYEVEYSMMMMDMDTKIWASTDVPFDWKDFSEKMFANWAAMNMRLDEDSIDELRKIEGFQIKSETTMSVMGRDMTSTQEVLEIQEKNAPDGTYTLPAGYEKTDMIKGMNR